MKTLKRIRLVISIPVWLLAATVGGLAVAIISIAQFIQGKSRA